MTETALPVGGREPPLAPGSGSPDPDAPLLARLREGDERAFMALVSRHHALMLRVAQSYVRTPSVAEEVVQETWLGVLAALPRFEGRSTLKTWIFRILTNRAKTRGAREARSVPLSELEGDDGGEPAVAPERFLNADHPRWSGHWAAAPSSWSAVPDDRLLARETRAHLRSAILALPARQQQVIQLRDVEGWSPEEVCDALGISEGNQRVLLHRARSKVREALEDYLDG